MIEVVQGDIANLRASGILRPVSAEWDAVSSAARRIEIAAGPDLIEQCEKLGELPVGSAVLTSAGQLNADFIVHAIVRSLDEQASESTVHRALQNALRRCVEWGIESLAVPPLGTGAGNLDAEEAAAVMIPVLLATIRCMETILRTGTWAEALPWLRLLMGFDVIFLTLGVLLFDWVIEG